MLYSSCTFNSVVYVLFFTSSSYSPKNIIFTEYYGIVEEGFTMFILRGKCPALCCGALFLCLCLSFFVLPIASVQGADTAATQNKYVGVDACADCHEDIVANFRKNAAKAHSDESILTMREKLTDAEFRACFECHTTGNGEASGFVSFETTPHLGIVGCESCHGMGYLHTIEQTTDSLTVKPSSDVCQKCHDDTRVKRIKYDGKIHAGGH